MDRSRRRNELAAAAAMTVPPYPYLSVRFVLAAYSREEPALVDTGFDGHLAIPEALAACPWPPIAAYRRSACTDRRRLRHPGPALRRNRGAGGPAGSRNRAHHRTRGRVPDRPLHDQLLQRDLRPRPAADRRTLRWPDVQRQADGGGRLGGQSPPAQLQGNVPSQRSKAATSASGLRVVGPNRPRGNPSGTQ